ncbi:erythrocyte membrane protein 1, PfEMP1, putative [Plasmodium gaboni]|uniref:Erythrocyte membrane protein 1, PfEMP1, putative n=1 Tax=Plasmodium gaboni TaxID=647221 RepID=A0ABY1UKP1_9APIC|nr:erythrocyte membrane protein 1, PfEMP1, putative [Plasmodium gaboni]
MGNTDSNTKSSLLKNFQYMLHQDDGRKPLYKLLYFDYLNFLHYELEHEAWKWKIYLNYVNGGGGGGSGVSLSDEQKSFCTWKNIQNHIFDKLKTQVTGSHTYNWDKDVLPLIDIKGKKILGSSQGCSSINVDINTIDELKKPEFPALTPSQTKSCDLKTSKDIHVPLRRRALLVDSMYDYLNGIKTEITDNHNLEDVLKDVNAVKTKKGNVAVDLKKQMIDGLGNEFSKLIKQKHDSNHDVFCKEWQRTMDDYHTLFLGDDIVDEDETKKIQCIIKNIERTVGKEKFQKEWSQHFKTTVKGLQTTHFTHPITKEPCNMDPSNKTQCVRFFEEWAEEFCKLKKDLGEMVVSECRDTGTGNTGNGNCKKICDIYKKFLEETKPYFYAYMNTCDKPQYGNNGQTKDELQKSFSKAAMESMTDCCKDNGHCSPTQLFDLTEDISNIRYKCLCKEGLYNKTKDTEQKCIDLLNTDSTRQGRSLAATTHPVAAQMSASVSAGGAGCAGNNSGGNSVKTIAQQIQAEAKSQLDSDDGNVGHDGKSILIGKLEQALFGATGSEKATNICDLDKNKHTNATNGKGDPCQGKDKDGKEKFKIGDRWGTQDKNQVKDGYTDVLFPPRRLVMCTSNLENLDTNAIGFNSGGFAIHALLGDVLLAAKEEANKIIKQYKEKNGLNGEANDSIDANHKECICRAMKNSFADLGDIIRGRDLWIENKEMKQLETKLKTIFKKIHEKLTDPSKYNDSDGKYVKLRKYWWEANRTQVWDAMKCATKDLKITTGECKSSDGSSGNNQRERSRGRSISRGRHARTHPQGPRGATLSGGANIPPHDDYIPQKLRWLTEWSEWYCKRQSQLYTQVKDACQNCINGGECAECDKCQAKCKEYTKEITEWKTQWTTQKTQYNEFYTKATSGNNGGSDENEKYLYKFLHTLQSQNTGNTTYSTAGGYIQKELQNKICVGQNEFCNSSSDKYAFSTQPPEYTAACGCTTPCDIVNDILKDNDGTQDVDSCRKKYDEKTKTPNGGYPGWKCGNTSLVTDPKVCMPPRRQKLCIYYLEHMTGTTQNDLKNALIKCAAAETFLHWQYYINHGNGKDKGFDEKLKEGNIPDEFKRQMFYTLGDFRDLVVGTDISVKTKNQNGKTDVGIAIDNITNALNGGQPGSTQKPEDWWNQNASSIWDAMVCALTHGMTDTAEKEKLQSNNTYSSVTFGDSTTGGTSLSQFVERPQFLRWMTEWGENYCKKQKEEYDKVSAACKYCKVTNGSGNVKTCDKNGNCKQCDEACKSYKKMIDKWQPEWTKQRDKYDKLYQEARSANGGKTTTTDKEVVQYLKEKTKSGTTGKPSDDYSSAGKYLQKEGYTKNCNESTQNDFTSGSSNNYAFRNYPHDHKDKCTCEQAPTPPKPPVPLPKCTDNKILDAANNIRGQAEAQWQSGEKSGTGTLVGDISKAKFNGTYSDLSKEDICKLEKDKHTNDVREQKDRPQGPCSGKGKERFNIGAPWTQDKTNMRSGYSDVLLPPRRQHMCTSNLENLAASGQDPLSGVETTALNHSFLGDVLLAAKEEGHMITQLHGGNTSGICTAMKYSFADLGDIIRGKDLWSKDTGMAPLEKHLEAIFTKIQQQKDIKDKYKNGDSETPKHKTLREDWWSANREQIWKAITCEAPETANLFIPSSDIKTKKWKQYKCGRDTYTPPDDYTPQRLRWMTEWTENYCKQMEKNYWWVKFNCGLCKGFKNSKKQNQEENKEAKKEACKRCVSMCTVYKQHVEKWQPQWNQMEQKYKDLYNGSGSGGSNDDIKKETKTFLQTVKGQHTKLCEGGNNNDKKKYETLSEYVTSMGGGTYCNDTTQTKFTDNGSSSGNDDTSAFAKHPKDYKKECEENKNVVTVPTQPTVTTPEQKGQDACTIVDKIMENKKSDGSVGDCKNKHDTSISPPYPGWDCTDQTKKDLIQTSDSGACMPPRGQKLCLAYLTQLNTSSSKEKDLREAYIKTAAAETFLHWQYYKEHGGNSEAQKQLEQGKIPHEFMRSMFYTYGDYRDLCVDKDIGNKKKKDGQKNDVGNAIDKIQKILTEEDKRTKFWEDNGPSIWKGMLCALSHTVSGSEKEQVKENLTKNYSYEKQYDSTNLEKGMANYVLYTEFTPQFLRWFTEWADQFCLEQQKQFVQLHNKCHKCQITSSSSSTTSSGKATCNKSGADCTECQKQCQEYTKFIGKWKGDYNKQKGKFDREKESDTYDEVPLAADKPPAYKFLDQSLDVLGLHDNCMKIPSTQPPTNSGSSDSMPQSLDPYPPGDFKDKCECDNTVATTSSSVTSSAPGSAANGNVNLCGGNTDNSLDGTVNQEGTHFLSKRRSGKNTENELVKISNNDSYLGRGYQNPCGNKKIEDKKWICEKNGNSAEYKPKEANVCLPPRTQALCVGNLGADTTGTKSKKGKIKDVDDEKKLLTEVLLAANLEGKNLKTNYGNNNDEDKKLLCSKVKYSFGDLADIIKGTNIYDFPDGDKTENNLNTIFNNIYQKLGTEQDKYKSGGNPNLPKLREAWWNANRKHVWKVLFDGAAPTDRSGCLKKLQDETPNIDCTPQFVRWLEEWAEEFCRRQKEEYEKVKEACKDCTVTSGTCDKNSKTGKCKDCDGACQKYQQMVKEWQPQWNKQKEKYEKLYTQATSGGTPTDEVVKYLKEKTKTSGNDYDSAGKYLTKEGYTSGCETTQDNFDKNGSGSSGNTNYAFEQYPDTYRDRCTCVEDTKPTGTTVSSGQPQSVGTSTESVQRILSNTSSGQDASSATSSLPNPNPNHPSGGGPVATTSQCKIDEYIKQNQTQSGGGCNQKNFNNKNWNCDSQIDKKHDGACMSPRRQSLCIFYLKDSSVTDKNTLRTALLKSASLETYRLWEQYKKNKEQEKPKPNLDEELKKDGNIPPDFLRTMFYTYSDLKDLILDKDISTKVQRNNSQVVAAKKKITTALKNSGKTSGQQRESWWQNVEKEVWEAMVCALSYNGKSMDTTTRNKLQGNDNNKYDQVKFGDNSNSGLASFAARPQFLRWMTEWGEDFCRQYTKEYNDLEAGCNDYECNGKNGNQSNKEKCQKACNNYKKFINEWEKHYKSQSKKFKEKKTEYQDADNDVKNSNTAREYLQKKLEKMKCTDKNGKTDSCKYDCMERESTQPQKPPNSGEKLPQSMDYPPENYVDKCNCVAAKPAAVRPPAAAAAKPAKVVPQHSPPQGGASQGDKSPSPKVGPGSATSTECVQRQDKGDGGVCGAKGLKINTGHEGRGSIEISSGSSSTQAPSTTPVPTASTTSAPTTSAVSEPHGGAGGAGGAGGGGGEPGGSKAAGATTGTNSSGNGLWDLIKTAATTTAAYAGIGGIYGTAATIEAAKVGIPMVGEVAKTVGKPIAKVAGTVVGTAVQKTVGNIVYPVVKDMLSGSTQQNQQALSPAGPQPTAAPAPAGVDSNPGSSGSFNSSTSGTGSTGNQNPDTGGHSSSGSPQSGAVGPTGPAGPSPPGGPASPQGQGSHGGSQGQAHSDSGPNHPQNDQADVPINDILSSTLPVGLSFALGSIALLYYLKKKPKITRPTDIFRVLEIPQKDYEIPRYRSSNRYVPYTKYRGKTYIYVENDDDSDTYIGDISSSDVTTSDSEYDEVDINDIYPYKSPKYKTLIEVVLKPSNKTYDAQDTHTYHMEDTSDTTTKKLTDNEWNELKQDFILNMLQNDNIDIANENPPGNICMDPQPDTVDNSFGEKPFITQIQDRKLYCDNEITYNIEWNVPENINRTTNNLDDQKYVTSNLYTGIDLINDSLNSGNDIYDELLKRKENELFGTKHPKNTSTNNVAKDTYSDPISNKIDLFHK